MGKHIEGKEQENRASVQISTILELVRLIKYSWQTWNSLTKITSLGYNPDAKPFTLDDAHWEELIKIKFVSVFTFYYLHRHIYRLILLAFIVNLLIANLKLPEFR